jgi:hypothetical protein
LLQSAAGGSGSTHKASCLANWWTLVKRLTGGGGAAKSKREEHKPVPLQNAQNKGIKAIILSTSLRQVIISGNRHRRYGR